MADVEGNEFRICREDEDGPRGPTEHPFPRLARMRPADDVRKVFTLADAGCSISEIARRVGIARATVRTWLGAGEAAALAAAIRTPWAEACPVNCPAVVNVDRRSYAYVLGQYLGDGHIVHDRRGVYRICIYCCAAYPGIVEECTAALQRVLPTNRVGQQQGQGVTIVRSYSKHLPCLFPQHGVGPKHQRLIALEPWQAEIALDEHPELFVRGLIHSDGWRGTNRVRGANGRPYGYPRYQFSNRSADIRRLLVRACDALGVETRQMNAWTISIARRASVALLDEFVGPKS
jgi:hypothetical protein